MLENTIYHREKRGNFFSPAKFAGEKLISVLNRIFKHLGRWKGTRTLQVVSIQHCVTILLLKKKMGIKLYYRPPGSSVCSSCVS